MYPFKNCVSKNTMPKTISRLSDLEVKKAKAKEKDYTLFDGEGLSVRIRKTGRKSWLFNYLNPETNKRTNLSIGTYPYTSLKDARFKIQEYRSLLELNIDPQRHIKQTAQEQHKKSKNTLQAVATEWFTLKSHAVSADYANDIWRSLELHLFPTLGSVPITRLKPQQIIKCLRPLEHKGTLETVRRLCQRINEIMDYALNAGLIEQNSVARINKVFKTPTKTHLPALSPEELPLLMAKLATANIHLITRCLIEFELHTMLRPGEAVRVKWTYIDFDKSLCHMPAGAMKAKRPHTIPLAPQVMVILQTLREITGGFEYVFVGANNQKTHRNTQTVNMALKRIGFTGITVAHGFRALASTTLNEHGSDPDVIESALAHQQKNEIRAAYNRSTYLTRRRDLMNWWSQHIETSTKRHFSIATAYQKSHKAT